MSGRKMALIVVSIILICLIFVYFSISAFYKKNPHQPNLNSISSTTEIIQLKLVH